ncbi:MAG TPA: glutamate--cysteine ligase [Gammaproteobacteria bacterium]|nr:glutamate--cysteine ligase [Gammaproteobacteria bacterium]
MGEEIHYGRFNKTDYQQFVARLKNETQLLKKLFEENGFTDNRLVAGYELEAWLINDRGKPLAINEQFLQAADNDMLSPELAKFNIELNVEPELLQKNVLGVFETRLNRLWNDCANTARHLDAEILGIGILPTLDDSDLTLKNISLMERYRALNEQVLRQRRGMAIELNINGMEHLHVSHKDVMLEAAATSLQIHLQVPQQQAARYFNACLVLSAPMVAVSANSPCLFGKRLWQETRIPVFEQAVPTGGYGGAASGPVHRVTFGSAYVRDSLFECFQENLEHYPVLLPVHYDEDASALRHLRLHNGTIWRWNRPLIGFNAQGEPHLRIEHRVCAAAPSNLDNIANIAFFYGLLQYYATQDTPVESLLSFADTKHNFYRAAQLGLKYKTRWPGSSRNGGQNGNQTSESLQKIILDRLLPEAETGLGMLGIDAHETERYLEVIEQRVSLNRTGSQWQLDFLDAHQGDRTRLTLNYLRNQKSGQPVHTWSLDDRC